MVYDVEVMPLFFIQRGEPISLYCNSYCGDLPLHDTQAVSHVDSTVRFDGRPQLALVICKLSTQAAKGLSTLSVCSLTHANAMYAVKPSGNNRPVKLNLTQYIIFIADDIAVFYNSA